MTSMPETPAATLAAASREACRLREGTFLERFRSAFGKVREVYHPVERRYYTVEGAARTVARERTDAVRRLMERLGQSESGVFAEMPADRSIRVEIATGGLLTARRVRVVVAALTLSPLQELLRDGATAAPVGLGALREAVGEVVREPGAFHYVGVCATTGFAAECRGALPTAPNLLLACTEPAGATAWRVAADAPDRWQGLLAAFDPETDDERVARCRRWIEARSELGLRGGHVLLPDLERDGQAEGFAPAIVQRAVAALAAAGDHAVRDVGERRILQRARFPQTGGGA